MLIRETAAALQASLREAGLALDHIDPWSGWKVFKQSLHRGVEDGFDVASFQFLPTDIDPDYADEAVVLFVRQFSERDRRDGTDRLIGRVVLELRYAAQHFHRLPAAAIWSLDFHSLEEWVSVVEGQPGFQEAMARAPLLSEVFYEEGSEEHDP